MQCFDNIKYYQNIAFSNWVMCNQQLESHISHRRIDINKPYFTNSIRLLTDYDWGSKNSNRKIIKINDDEFNELFKNDGIKLNGDNGRLPLLKPFQEKIIKHVKCHQVYFALAQHSCPKS